MDVQKFESLIHRTEESYGESFKSDLLEQYKLYVQSAENVSARRINSNHYLLTLNVALSALYGVQFAGVGQNNYTILASIAGILVSIFWFLIIKSHANLNAIKFDVIRQLEQHLPAVLYGYEWQLAEEGKGKTYRAVTRIEQWIPVLFAILHVILATVIILAIAGVVDWTR